MPEIPKASNERTEWGEPKFDYSPEALASRLEAARQGFQTTMVANPNFTTILRATHPTVDPEKSKIAPYRFVVEGKPDNKSALLPGQHQVIGVRVTPESETEPIDLRLGEVDPNVRVMHPELKDALAGALDLDPSSHEAWQASDAVLDSWMQGKNVISGALGSLVDNDPITGEFALKSEIDNRYPQV